MNRKITAYITAAAAVLSLITIAATSKNGSVSSPPAVSESAASGTGTPLYILREYGGHVGIFEYGGTSPSEVLDVLIADLPEADRAALSSGVAAYSEEELQKRIEDYDS